jgi:hypothetical protein
MCVDFSSDKLRQINLLFRQERCCHRGLLEYSKSFIGTHYTTQTCSILLTLSLLFLKLVFIVQ